MSPAPPNKADGAASARLRSLCLACPESIEKLTWERSTYRVRDRIFALESERDDGPAVWIKAPPGSQVVLVGSDPERFFVPPYLGPKGWVGIRLDAAVDWPEVGVLVRRSYRLIAPKRLAVLLVERDGRRSPAKDNAG